MSRKEKSLHEKMKQFFGIKETVPINLEKLKTEPYIISLETLKEISSDNAYNHRLKGLKGLYEPVMTKKMGDNTVVAICNTTKDLLLSHYPTEIRHEVLQFYCLLMHGQKEQMKNMMRSYFFSLIRLHCLSEDVIPRLDMLKALSDDGKDITYFEEEIGPFLLNWMPDMLTEKSTEFLPFVVNIIKFNAAYLDDEIIAGIVLHTCSLCGRTKIDEDIEACLDILDAVICYHHLPASVLESFIYALCLTVNIEKFSPRSWKLMRNLLGTNVGTISIYRLCVFLQDKSNYGTPPLLRGAIFFVSMALWGSNKVPTLLHPPTSVLPCFLKVLDSGDNVIASEIVLSCQRLIKKNGKDLPTICWDVIFDIIEKILKFPEVQQANQHLSILAKTLHELISVVEENCSEKERLFKIVESCSSIRNEESVINLIAHHAKSIKLTGKDFVPDMNKLLEKYFKNEKRRSVQLEVLKVLHNIRKLSGHLFEDDLIDQSILQYMCHLEVIPDVHVRKAAVQILLEVAETCITVRFFDIVDIIEKVIKHSFDYSLKENQETDSGMKEIFSDVLIAVQGLISIFKKKLYMLPSSHCVKIYSLLVNHIQSHYQHISYLEEVVKIRKLIFSFLSQFRANNQKQIGMLIDDKVVKYSVYVSCDLGEASESVATSPPPGSPSFFTSVTISYLSFGDAFNCLVTCLKQEKDWGVLELILKKLPKLLQNKSLIISGSCAVATLCVTLCSMHGDRNLGFPESLKNTPCRFTRTDVQGHIFPSVSALTSYHSRMESHIQRMLIKCLQAGLVSRSAKICMEGLTLCTLEMQDSMVKLLPHVLLKLSKISATTEVAVSVLEFLSNLIRLPQLYVSFVEDQYMSIFAIALPYTNPFKFNQYTVALAHHVIAMWFLKCRIPFRKDFAKFITKGLRSNLNIPCEGNPSLSTHNSNEESSQNSDNKDSEKSKTEAIITLHTELMETGLDLMARFTFGMSSNVPKRSPVAEFLLEKGQKSCWLVGNKIITITTSGCGTKSFKYGMCEKCYTACKNVTKAAESDDNDSIFTDSDISVEPEQVKFDRRKRHRSAFNQRSATLSGDMLVNLRQSKDDIHLHRQNFEPPDPSARRHTFYSSKVCDGAFQKFQMEQNVEHKEKEDKNCHLCSCWCTGWAEVHIRRPTGNTSWMMKIQNQLFLPSSPPDIQLAALASLVLPQRDYCESESERNSSFQHSSEIESSDFGENELTGAIEELNEGGIEIVPCQKSNSPIRRTNSSPDMNTGWSSFEALNKENQKTESIDFFEDSLNSDIDKTDPPSSQAFEDSGEINSSYERSPIPRSSKPALKLDLSPNNKSIETTSSRSAVRTLSFASKPSTSAEKPLNKNDSQYPSSATSSFRDRGHTISVMSPINPFGSENLIKKPETSRRSGMSPSFVFLQLFHNSCFGPITHKPLLLQQTETNNRALGVLDHTPPYDTHKIGVVYVGPGQVDNEVAILSNVSGSARYVKFLRGLGNFVILTDVDPQAIYLGGLDTKGEDGKFGLIWHDDVMQVVFHVSTLMFNMESDTMRNEKKKHIANDSVIIVYNESSEEYELSTIKGQVTNACVIIQPEDVSGNVVTVKLKSKDLMETFGHSESYIVSDESLPIFVRQMALHANLASLIISRTQHCNKYAHVSNWLERLRTIKRLRSKVLEEKRKNESLGFESTSNNDVMYFDDFTDYV